MARETVCLTYGNSGGVVVLVLVCLEGRKIKERKYKRKRERERQRERSKCGGGVAECGSMGAFKSRV